MMTVIERAARALAAELKRQEPQKGGTYFVNASNPRETMIDGTFNLHAIARAVIVAIREPSETMLRAGQGMADEYTPGTPVDLTWKTMIDELLSEDRA